VEGTRPPRNLKQLAVGRSVTLLSDPTLERLESPGARPLFYVDRDDGADVGLEMVRAGWADRAGDDQPVTISGSDPYGLDSDGDGVGCE
jgi:endonuclease YncB( thermonuclease family)